MSPVLTVPNDKCRFPLLTIWSGEDKRAEDVLYDMEIVEASTVVLEDITASINVNSNFTLEDFASAIVSTSFYIK